MWESDAMLGSVGEMDNEQKGVEWHRGHQNLIVGMGIGQRMSGGQGISMQLDAFALGAMEALEEAPSNSEQKVLLCFTLSINGL